MTDQSTRFAIELRSWLTLFAALLMLGLGLTRSSLAEDGQAEREELIQLTGRVRVLLEVKCHKCHSDQLEEPDGDFGYVLDLPRLVKTPELIVPGDPGRSELFRLIRDGDMPPFDQTEIRRLEPDEVNAVRRWIAAGAPTELPKELPKYREPVDPAYVSEEAILVQLKTKAKRISLEMSQEPLSTILSEIQKKSGIEIVYRKPTNEPKLSLKMKNRPVFEALEYLALCGNMALSFDAVHPKIGPNPPPELPIELPPVRPQEKRQKEATAKKN
jgi:mono/diheme cytochrome c family protein